MMRRSFGVFATHIGELCVNATRMLERRKEEDSEAREKGRSIAAGSSAVRGYITGWLCFALISLVPELQPQCF